MHDSVRFLLSRRMKQGLIVGVVLALFSCQPVDATANLGDNALVPFNSGTGFSSPNDIGGQPPLAAIFTSVHNATRAPSMAGRGGEPSGCRFLCPGLLTLPRACHPRLAAGSGSDSDIGGTTMPRIALRTFRALFPLTAVPVSTLPTLAEARALAALLVSRGKRVAIQPAAQGFAVSEVTA